MLDFRQAYYYQVYQLCARGRQVSMGGALPIDIVPKIRDYCDLFYITNVSERERLIRHVVSLDNAYLELMEEKRKQSSR